MTNIGSIVFDIIANTSSVDKMVSNIDKEFSALESQAKSVGKSMDKVGKGLSKRLTLPIVAFGAGAVKAFADFDSAMNKSLAIMDVTAEQQGRMEKAAVRASKNSRFAAREAAESYFFLASAGMDAEQSIAALPTVTEFAQAGMFDLATATDLATDAQTALGLSSKDPIENLRQLNRITDVLVKSNVLANASTRQFSEALTNDAATAARLFGKDVEETVAILTAYADQGIKGAEAGNMLGRALRLLDQAARAETEAFEAAGVAVFDANKNMRNMADIVDDLTRHLGNLSTEERGAALETLGFATLSQKAITPLLGMGDAIRANEAALDEAYGTRMAIAAKQQESFSAGVTRAKNNVMALAISIGKTLAPAMSSIANVISSASDAFSRLTETERVLVIGIGAVLAAIGPLMVIFGKLLVLLPAIKAGIAALGIGLAPFAATLGVAAAAGAALGIALAEILEEMDELEAKEQQMSFAEKINEWILTFRVFINEVKFGIKLFMELGQNMFAEWFTNFKRLKDLITGQMTIGEFFDSQTTGMVQSFQDVLAANRAARDAGFNEIMDSTVDNIAKKVAEAEKTAGVADRVNTEESVADILAGLDDQIALDMSDIEAEFNKQLMNLPMTSKPPEGITEPFAKAIEDGTIEAYKLSNEIGTNVPKEQLAVQKDQLKEQKKEVKVLEEVRDGQTELLAMTRGIRVGAFA